MGIMTSHRGSLFIVVVLALLMCPVAWIGVWSQTKGLTGVPLATKDRLRNPGWWPTKGAAARSEYRGSVACRECHAMKAATQPDTPMALAATPAGSASLLRKHDQLVFHSGAYEFQISARGDGPIYSVSDGKNSLQQALAWAFGTGEVGQTYVFQREGNFYESRVSFYPRVHGLDLTLGHHAPTGNDLAGALGRLMAGPETRLCFGCHTTASSTSGQFDVTGLIPGVTCEACHGPGARHITAMKQKQVKRGLQAILNPGKLGPVDSVDFCGACHRTAWDVALASPVGIANVRFQPYRLEKSRCWGKGDARLTCMACHDPHQQLVRDPSAYDEKCLNCHVSGSDAESASAEATREHPGKACPRGTSKCVTCHMAKYEIPRSHAQFTDHWIRIILTNAAYPE
jgi:hypothetical protein